VPAAGAGLDPAAAPFRLLLVRRVTDHHSRSIGSMLGPRLLYR
jgi:hypothetical protein